MGKIFDVNREEFRSQGLEELPGSTQFDCSYCGFEWCQIYIPGVTDV